MNHPVSNPAPTIALPDCAALCLNAKEAYYLSADGELKTLPHDQVKALVHKKPVLVCHAPYIRGRLGHKTEFYAFDVLDLFAFVHPGQFATPTVNGVCKALGLVEPESLEDAPLSLIDITKALLGDLRDDPYKAKADPLEIARVMGLNGKGWPWTSFIFAALGEDYDPAIPVNSKTGLNVWKNLPEWSEDPPEPPPSHHAVTGDEARDRLKKLLGDRAEKRPSQMEYATNMTAAFAPVGERDAPKIVLAEAGTGVGKTLGYLSPASVWAEKNKGTVWISTYTKNLQRQIDQELDKLYPNEELKDAHVATRKGRENYLCLLNLEETAAGAALAKHADAAIASGIMARWTVATKDGDLTGGQYPGWLTSILGYRHTAGLSDTRGECIYSACDHYHRCFVEHAVRKSKHARIVVANHALVMINAAIAAPKDMANNTTGDDLPGRYVFDEGHHLFDAADSAYAAHLSAREARDLRRWILGNEGGRRQSRARGLKRRAEDLTDGMQEAEEALRKIINAAECLPQNGWTRRLRDGVSSGPTELFLAEVYKQVYARANGRDGPYSLETEVFPVEEPVLERAKKLREALKELQKPMLELSKIFYKKLADDEGMLDSDTRKRLEAVSAALERRSALTLQAWILMLENLQDGTSNEQFVDWMEIERIDGRAIDVGLYRHHVDPMKPFAASITPHLHGMAVTSATLRDGEDWESAQARTGAKYLGQSHDVAFSSPFDYAKQTRIYVVNDVRKDDMRLISTAYKTLFEAANGSALGLFTAISRLRAVHENIAQDLEAGGLPLYSQHVDEIDTGTLVDMFREDTRSCLLGTDAIRDGVDVPGESLRLIIFDRVPWPRPTILHKARREAFGGRAYDEMITRLKLKQAFGRLIRRGDDKGVFVMMDSMLPSRLQTAFPPDVEVVKCGLSEVANGIKEFLA